MVQASTVIPAMTTARVKMVRREESETPLLNIRANREGSIISPTADIRTSMDSRRICCIFNVTFEKIVFILFLLSVVVCFDM